MTIAVCILAKNEAERIGALLKQLGEQSLLTQASSKVEVHVVSNGCTDNTAEVAAGCGDALAQLGVRLKTYDIHPGGKSRAWNRMVHELAGPDIDTFVFCDADIDFVDKHILCEMVEALRSEPVLKVVVGYPLKNVVNKDRKSLVDRFSLAVSSQTRHQNAITGQLYAIRAEEARRIWLPDETPGEDGFLNAMVNTNGFTQVRPGPAVREHMRPTHYYEDLKPTDFVRHERRLIVGTVINRWIFEYLWSLKLSSPAGPLIRDLNKSEPDWVERIVRERAMGQRWLIPNAIVFARMKTRAGEALWKRAAFLPIAAAATLITIPPAIAANRLLKRTGAAKVW